MKKYLKYILHAAILIGLGVAATKYLNGEEVLNALKTFDYSLSPMILVLSLVYFFAWKGEREVQASPGTAGPAAAFRKSPKGDIDG